MTTLKLLNDERSIAGLIFDHDVARIQRFDDISNNHINFMINVIYSETNWLMCRDAHYLVLDENPDIAIIKNHVSVNATFITVSGYVDCESFVEVM